MATDTQSLGVRQGTLDVDVNHRIPTVHYPEGGLLSYWLCLRSPPLFKGMVNPIASPNHPREYVDLTGDPTILASMPPYSVKRGELDAASATATTAAGVYPRGQHLRTGWNHVGDQFNSGMVNNWMLQPAPAEIEDMVLHQDVTSAFGSKYEGVARASLRFNQMSDSMVPPGTTNIFAGAT